MPSLARESDISRQVGQDRRLSAKRGSAIAAATRGEVFGGAAPFVDLGLHEAANLLIRQLSARHLGGSDSRHGSRNRPARLRGDHHGFGRPGVVDRTEH